jgi:HSP20 family protein
MSQTTPDKRETKSVAQVPVSSANWPFEAFRREIDQLFDRFAGPSWLGRYSFGSEFPFLKDTGGFAGPVADVAEKEKEYEITAELPGLDAKNIEVKVSDNRLTIMGEKKEETEEKGKDRHVSERRYGSFIRSFALPKDVDAAQIEAQFANGVLTIKLPKSTAALKNERTIEIKAA